jgi:hypothetical protein
MTSANRNQCASDVVHDMGQPFAEGAFRLVAMSKYTEGPRTGEKVVHEGSIAVQLRDIYGRRGRVFSAMCRTVHRTRPACINLRGAYCCLLFYNST